MVFPEGTACPFLKAGHFEGWQRSPSSPLEISSKINNVCNIMLGNNYWFKQPKYIAYIYYHLTYLPHKAVAEVSKDKEPIRRGCVELNWFESQLISGSSELRLKWFGCQLIWDSNDLVVNRCVLQMILVVCWFELQVSWLSIDLRFNWFDCQSIWDSNDLVVNRFEIQELVVNWFEIQVIWLSIDVRFDWFCLSVDFGFKWVGCQLWSEIQMSWLSIDLRFKWFGCQMIWGSSELVFNWCVIQIILSNEAFARDFLQNWSFEAQKRSISARLPSKMTLWNSKTKLFCETSFKIEALKITNEAFLRDFLQNWHVEQTLDIRIPIRFNDFQVDASKVLRLPRKSCAEAIVL